MTSSKAVLLFGCFSAIVLGINARNLIDGKTATPNQLSFQYCSAEIGTNSHSNCVASIFRFTANVEQIGRECVESEEITLSNLQWNVKLCKRSVVNSTNTTNVVDVFLQSSSNDSTLQYTCLAQATIKLFSVDSTNNFIVKKFSKRYTNLNSTFGIEEFTSWDNFVQNYVSENEANFEIEISTNAEHKTPSNVEQIYTRLHIMLDNVTSLKEYHSPAVIVRGIKWTIHIQKMDNELGVYLEANDDNDFDMSLSYQINATIKLLTFSDNGIAINRSFSHIYRQGWSQNGFKDFLSWKDFIDKDFEYVVQDKANFLIQFKVEAPKSIWDEDENDTTKGRQSLECNLCHDEVGSGKIMSPKCGHIICNECHRNLGSFYACPVCGENSTSDSIHTVYLGDKD